MIKKKTYFTLAAIAITALVTFTGSIFRSSIHPEKADIKSFGFEYFPLKSGKTFIYDSNFGETKSIVRKSENEWVVVNESEDFRYVQNFIIKSDGIYITQTEQYLDVFLFISSEAKIVYNEPALRIPMPLNSDSKWRWDGMEYVDDDSSRIIIEGKFIGSELLTTPAGTFDCVNIELHVQSEHGSKSIVNEWLAPEIGLVKLHAKIEGAGLLGVLQGILGYDEINFELKEII